MRHDGPLDRRRSVRTPSSGCGLENLAAEGWRRVHNTVHPQKSNLGVHVKKN
jgi:hypothetical protein